jgi:hypothetical protein
MRKLIATIALLALIDTSAAIGQPVWSRNPTAPSKTQKTQLLPLPASVGHRQPRADQAPDEKNLDDPNVLLDRENAAMARQVKGICRGC